MALAVGSLIILPIIYYYWKTNSGIFKLLNESGNLHIEMHPDPAANPPGTHADQVWMKLADISGYWHFAPGDDPQWADPAFDHSRWKKIYVPGMWESAGFDDYDGHGWYRREFDLSGKLFDRDLRLNLGIVDDVDEVFINGQSIGSTGSFPPTYASAWNTERSYVVPENVLVEGRNLIAVHVYDAQQGGGIVRGDIGLYASNFPRALINLEGEWQFRSDDEQTFSTIRVPGIWEEQGYSDYDGMAHYQKTFPALDVSGDEVLVLSLGKIDDTDEVTINGEFVGRTGTLTDSDREIDSHYYRLSRRYEFPASILQEQNTIQLRVHDSGGEGGIYSGTVAIYRKQ